jgi:cobalt-zinc-cadmium efflux system protein
MERSRSEVIQTRLGLAIALNIAIVIGQVVAGVAAGSLGLISDATHNLTDVAALVLALTAVRWSRRTPTAARSFGWHRAPVLAAQANAAAILAVTGWIVYESARRLLSPKPVEGGLVLAAALAGFVVNGGAMWLLRAPSRESNGRDLNLASAMLHLASDALASLGVAVSGAIMLAVGGWYRLDPGVSLLIALAIGWQGWRLLRESNAVLLEGTPLDIDPTAVAETITSTPGVEAVHDLHIWALSGELRALSAHVVVRGHPSLEDAQEVANRVRSALHASPYRISHATLELECESCERRGPACDLTAGSPAGVSLGPAGISLGDAARAHRH